MSRPRSPIIAQVAKAILADEQFKAVAVEHGVSASCISKWAAYLGYRKMFVTAAERRAVMQRRRAHA